MPPLHHVDVPVDDPHNDRMAAQARDELAAHVASARVTVAQALRDKPAAIACIAVALERDVENMPRDRMAALLAVAMVQLAETTKEPPCESCG